MKLINTISIFLIAILFSSIYAQDNICGTESNTTSAINNNSSNSSIYSFSTDENFLNTFPQRNMNIAIWGIEKTDGSQSITQSDAYDMVEYLNAEFNQFNMCFNLINFKYLISDQYYNTTVYAISPLFNTPEVSAYDGDAIKVIVPNYTQIRGRAWINDQQYCVRANQITTGINIHELGHVFDLEHTHEQYESSWCERVTRDPNDPDYNAETAGDYVVDTQASPKFYGDNMQYITMDCSDYTGDLTDCNGTPYNITSSEIENFMAYTRQHCRTLFTTGQKIRMHEYIQYKEDTDYSNILDNDYIDLSSSNSSLDEGIEPDNQTDVIWDSPDIWVRNQPDGFTVQEHEDLEYVDDSTPVYVYVKVKNNSCNISSGSDELELYWAKGGIGQQTWPDVWNGWNNSSNSLDIGNQIGSQTIPAIGSGNEQILEFQWQPKNPDVYENAGFTSKPRMFCFLSRIESTDDPMTFPEVSNPATNTRNNNNIVYKNTTTINLSGNGLIGSISAGNLNLEQPVTSDINFFTNQGNLIWEEAEIRIRLSESLWEAWQDSGANSTDVRILNSSERIIYVNGNNSSLDDINFDPNEWGILTPRINFLIREVTNETYTLNISQTLSETDEVLGGFTYNINRNSSRQYFTADATIEDDLNNTELEAKDINENATYNWYDEDGNFISSGQTLSVTKAKLKNYKLEVIADSDGHKDYKTFTVKEDRSITSISPNPTLNDFTINYKVGTANSAFITITNVMTGVSNNYILDLSNNSKSINLSNNPSGQYIINLVTDNVIVDTKNLLKN